MTKAKTTDTRRAADAPLVSIVVPSKDRRRRLSRTLAFLRSQTYPNLEIVISDDGSSDGTAAMVDSLGDDRLRVVRSEVGTGVSRARNRGIAAATGRYVAFCDDDDLWLPTKIERQVRALLDTGAAWATCGAVHTGDDLSPVHTTKFPSPEKIHAEIAHVNPIPGGCSSVLVDADALAVVGGFDPELSMFADWDLWLRLYLEHGQPAVVHEYLMLYLVHDAQMTRELVKLASELRTFRTKHSAARDQLPRPRVDGVDWWAVQSLRAAGRPWAALRYVATSPSSRSPLALRELRRPLFQRHRPRPPYQPTTPEQLAEQQRVDTAISTAKAILTDHPETTAL